ncbi:MAG: hypothetical protein PHP64_02225 [Actinomycetota bacterium]|nr:hypothetical protein [Actinomycetota bacterium]
MWSKENKESKAGGEVFGPYSNRRTPIKVSFPVYLVSVLLVGLIVFVVMLVQYLPGQRRNYRLEQAIRGADYVYIGIRIPSGELKERKLSYSEEDEVAKILLDMGAKKAKAQINPDRTRIPFEK